MTDFIAECEAIAASGEALDKARKKLIAAHEAWQSARSEFEGTEREFMTRIRAFNESQAANNRRLTEV